MGKGRFFFLEPSKIGSQHITLIQGYLQSILENESLNTNFKLHLCVSNKTEKSLPCGIKENFIINNIPVMNPEKRRLFRKSFLEFFVAAYYAIKIRPGDVLFISCMLPTSLLLLEIFFKFYRKENVYVVLHGEIEGIYEEKSESIFRIGYWALKWYKIREKDSVLSVVVLDDFIKDKLIMESEGVFTNKNVYVVHHPIIPFYKQKFSMKKKHSICFIGYKTKYKGFEKFKLLLKTNVKLIFKVVGNGLVENLSSGEYSKISSNTDYLKGVSNCTYALFPYTYRYDCSLSAAALDALAAGVHIIASDRPFFLKLHEYFGERFISIYRDDQELEKILQNINPESVLNDKRDRLDYLCKSKYSTKEVGVEIERMVLRPETNKDIYIQ